MDKNNKDSFYDTTLQLVGTVAKLPIIRVAPQHSFERKATA